MATETFGMLLQLVEACTTAGEAEALVIDQTEKVQALRPELLREEARAIVMENIGYLTGYLDRSEAGRLLALFNTRHPVFGAIGDWPKTPEEALELGKRMGERLKR